MVAIGYAPGPMHAATLLEQAGGCAPVVAAHNRAKRRVSLPGHQLGTWMVRSKQGDGRHLNVRSFQG
jgi:hypothetical protein